MRVQVMLAALLSLAWSGAPTGVQVKPWLQKPGTRALAVLFVPGDVPQAAAALKPWKKLRRKFGPDGLRVVVVHRRGGPNCPDYAWADELICDKGVVFRGFQAPTDRASGVLWDWQGQIVAQGPLRTLKRALMVKALGLRIFARGKDRRALHRALSLSARATLKFEPSAGQGQVPTRAVACPSDLPAARALTLTARIHRARLIAQLWDGPGACVRAQTDVGVAARDLTVATHEAMGRLLTSMYRRPQAAALRPSQAAPPSVRQSAQPQMLIEPGTAPAAGRPHSAQPQVLIDPDTPPATGQQSLQGFVTQWLGTRYRLGGKDRSAIDGPHFADELFRAVYGRNLTADLGRQLKSGPEVAFDPAHPERDLVPGDLLFFISYGYLPRSVMVYIGGGKVAHAVLIRGVVIDDVPKAVPNYLYLVARRPLAR